MAISIFLSHSVADKPFVRRLATDLENHGVSCWLDEAEIKVGEPLLDRVRQGLGSVNYVAVILSPDSVSSVWVQREVEEALAQEAQGGKIKILPIMYRQCEPPGFVLERLHADFTDESRYAEAFEKLVSSVGIVFNMNALDPAYPHAHLGRATGRAVDMALPLLAKPFHRPFQYVGMQVRDAAQIVGHSPNKVGNIIVDTDECHMLLEAEGNFISYVDVELKKTAPCYQNQEFDSEPILGAFSISPAELDSIRKSTHSHAYYDYRRKLKISVSCLCDGGPLSIHISAKYFGS